MKPSLTRDALFARIADQIRRGGSADGENLIRELEQMYPNPPVREGYDLNAIQRVVIDRTAHSHALNMNHVQNAMDTVSRAIYEALPIGDAWVIFGATRFVETFLEVRLQAKMFVRVRHEVPLRMFEALPPGATPSYDLARHGHDLTNPAEIARIIFRYERVDNFLPDSEEWKESATVVCIQAVPRMFGFTRTPAGSSG